MFTARRAASTLLSVAVAACSRTEPPSPPGTAPSIDAVAPLPSPLPDPVALVNGEPVPLRNVAVIAEQAMSSGAIPRDKRPYAYRAAANQLIARELLFEEAARRKLLPDPKLLEQAENEARVSYKDDKAWADFLKQQGMDETLFRRELRIQHTVQALMRLETDSLPKFVTDGELKAFYERNTQLFDSGERVRASHILIRVPRDATPARKQEQRAKAEGTLARIRKGGDFAKLARELSEDPGSKGKGGELGPFHRGQMVPPFEQAAYALKPGEVSGVVESPFGFHVIKLHERLPGLRVTLEQVKDKVTQRILSQRQQEHMQKLVEALRVKAKIENYL